MKKMKKLTALLLTLVMSLALAVPCFAAETESPSEPIFLTKEEILLEDFRNAVLLSEQIEHYGIDEKGDLFEIVDGGIPAFHTDVDNPYDKSTTYFTITIKFYKSLSSTYYYVSIQGDARNDAWFTDYKFGICPSNASDWTWREGSFSGKEVTTFHDVIGFTYSDGNSDDISVDAQGIIHAKAPYLGYGHLNTNVITLTSPF